MQTFRVACRRAGLRFASLVAPACFEGFDAPVNAGALRRQLSVWAVLAFTGLMAACASRPETGFLSPVAEMAAGASEHTLLVATTRERDARPGTLFNGERAQPLDYAKIAVSVPQKHVAGEIEWASSAPGNPDANFVVRQAAYIDGEKEFVSTLNAQLAMRPRGKRKVLIFIHGYNTMFAEGLYRFAQIVHDSNSPAVPVLFTWASRGQLSDYVYDNNSATAARDDLERTIRLVFASDADHVNILAHSMGNWVTVEALRQIKLTGGLPQLAKLGSIFLAAPDIDVDVFKSQMRRFGRPRKPFYIVLSRDDQALRVSSFLADKDSRLGSDKNTDELNALGAVVIDLTDVKANDSSNHAKFAQLAEIAPQLGTVLAKGISTNPESASQGQQAVGGTLEAIVTAPLKILGAPIRIIAGR
jgi:esterase/lipase superfamily enzyme